MILQITAQTGITISMVQLFSAISTIAGIITFFLIIWVKINSKISDLQRDIKDINDKSSMMENIYEQKLNRIEENSKKFYKELDVKYDKIELQMLESQKIMQDILIKLEVHLANCKNNHSKK